MSFLGFAPFSQFSKLSLVVLGVSTCTPPSWSRNRTFPSAGCREAAKIRSNWSWGRSGPLVQKVASPKTRYFFGKKKGVYSFANCLVFFLYIHVFFPPMYLLEWFRVTVCSFMFQTHVLMLQYINPSIETMKQFIWAFAAQGRILILVLRCTWNHPQRQMIPLKKHRKVHELAIFG